MLRKYRDSQQESWLAQKTNFFKMALAAAIKHHLATAALSSWSSRCLDAFVNGSKKKKIQWFSRVALNCQSDWFDVLIRHSQNVWNIPPTRLYVRAENLSAQQTIGALLWVLAMSSMLLQTNNNYKGNYRYESILWYWSGAVTWRENHKAR